MVYYYRNRKFFTLTIAVILLFFACKNKSKEETEPSKEKEAYIMYEPSEMSSFMNGLYAYNQQLKAKVIKGEKLSEVPLDLSKFNTAEMTKGKHRTETFNSHVQVFIDTQKAVVDSLSTIEVKQRYNTAINNCIACHKTECVGPIPRIKKLLIK